VSSNVGVVNVQIKADTAQFKRDVENLGKEAANATKPFGQTLIDVGGKIDATGRTLTRKLTLPIIGFAAAAVKTFADFDDKINQSLAIQGPEVAEKFRGEMEQTARTVAKDLGISASDAAESFFFLASAGLDAESQIASLPAVAAFSKAGMFDMARATDLATDAQSALGLVSDDASENLQNLTRVTDVLVGANTLANASVEQFGDALTTKAGAALRTVNKDVEEGVAVLAALADQGIKGAEAGEKLNVFLRDTSRAASANAEEFEALGLQIFDTDGNMRNLADIVENMEEVFGDMSDEQRVATMDALGLNRSVADVTRQLMGTSDSIREYEAELRDMGGITQDVAERQLQSFSGQMSIVKAELTDLALDIGPIVIEQFLKPLIENVRNIVARFSDMDDSTKQLVVRIAGIAAAVGPVLIVTGKLFKVLGTILGPIGKLVVFVAKLTFALIKVAFIITKLVVKALFLLTKGLMLLMKTVIPKLIKGVILLTKAMLANPFVLIAVAVVALIAGLVLAYKRFETFRNIVDGVISFVRSLIGGFVDFFIGIWEAIQEPVQTAFDVIGTIIGVAIEVITTIFQVWFAYVSFIFNAIKTVAEVVFGFIADFVSGVFEAIRVAVEIAFDVIQTIIETVIKIAVANFEVFQRLVEGVWNAIKVAAEFVFKLIQNGWQNLTNNISKAIEVARAIIEGVWNAVRAAAEFAFGIIRGAWDTMTGAIRSAIDNAKAVIEGVWTAVKSAAETAFGLITGAWDALTGAIGTAINTAKEVVLGVFETIRNRAESIFGGIKDFVSSVFTGAVDGIKSGLNIAIGLINGLIRAANKIPFVNIPEIRPLANGAIIGSPTLAMIGEAGSEAVIPLTRPRRAMELMEQSGLADMARGSGGRGGPALHSSHRWTLKRSHRRSSWQRKQGRSQHDSLSRGTTTRTTGPRLWHRVRRRVV